MDLPSYNYKNCTIFEYMEWHTLSGNPIQVETRQNIFGEWF